ncbi:hypothetical protein DAERI_090180 [Deinococcus aerius]|uniref:Uncharacterized protein n=1 Tax=Deinococcus aerius TaxID=200253 RepID=A0A2I9CX07_9DEIO|nr:DUF6544 family protein [Deinococcus aerius]GBF06594.1 hypothetical protein DAERI_090180 [Deinococcus aerius]
MILRRVLGVLFGLLVVLALAGWIGLQFPPTPFPAAAGNAAGRASTPEVVPIPAGLPGPVERFYRQTYGDWVPVITSAVITGRAGLRPLPWVPTIQGRFRFTHEAGRNYRHAVEATWYGRPFLQFDESYLGGVSRQETPFGSNANDPEGAQAANLALWAEAVWFPALYLTDPRVRWESLDDDTAVLSVPFGDDRERFLVRFDPATGRPFLLEAMRYKDVSNPNKVLWLAQIREWGAYGGVNLPRTVTFTWADEGRPSETLTAEDIDYNVDVVPALRGSG